jgi:hypothetical protein
MFAGQDALTSPPASLETLLRRDDNPSLHVGMEAAIILDDTGLFQNQACRLIRLEHDIKAAAHSRRMRDDVLVDPCDRIADLGFDFRRREDEVLD